MSDPAWLAIARTQIGVAEVPGKGDSPVIARWLRTLGAWWTDDATPWCGTFVGWCLREAGQEVPRHWYRARAYLEWGVQTAQPDVGSVVIFERTGGGHVGFVVGQDERNRLMVLGGNQGDRVSIAPFDRARVLGYRWPSYPPPWLRQLPRLASNGAPLSTNEA